MAATVRMLDRLIVAPVPGGWKVGGELDAHTTPALAEALASPRPDIAGRRLVVDLSGVGFIDSSGLETLLEARRRVGAGGRLLVLRRPSRCVRRLLDITEFRQAFRVDEQPTVCRYRAHRRRAWIRGRRPAQR